MIYCFKCSAAANLKQLLVTFTDNSILHRIESYVFARPGIKAGICFKEMLTVKQHPTKQIAIVWMILTFYVINKFK